MILQYRYVAQSLQLLAAWRLKLEAWSLGFLEFGIGTICFIHIFETNVDSVTGVAN